MDEAIKRFLQGGGGSTSGVFSMPELLMALVVSFVCCLILGYTYKQTHRGLSYSASFVHTMIIMGVTVSVIMMIIGSNIARAFSLVGALSIIRFRTAIKESRDVAFIFMTMATGMAAGTGFVATALIFAVVASVMVYFLSRFDIGALKTQEVLLKVHLPENMDYHTALNDIAVRYLHDQTLLSVESIRGGSLLELVYSVVFKSGADQNRFLDDVRRLNGNNKVALLMGRENLSI